MVVVELSGQNYVGQRESRTAAGAGCVRKWRGPSERVAGQALHCSYNLKLGASELSLHALFFSTDVNSSYKNVLHGEPPEASMIKLVAAQVSNPAPLLAIFR